MKSSLQKLNETDISRAAAFILSQKLLCQPSSFHALPPRSLAMPWASETNIPEPPRTGATEDCAASETIPKVKLSCGFGMKRKSLTLPKSLHLQVDQHGPFITV